MEHSAEPIGGSDPIMSWLFLWALRRFFWQIFLPALSHSGRFFLDRIRIEQIISSVILFRIANFSFVQYTITVEIPFSEIDRQVNSLRKSNAHFIRILKHDSSHSKVKIFACGFFENGIHVYNLKKIRESPISTRYTLHVDKSLSR